MKKFTKTAKQGSEQPAGNLPPGLMCIAAMLGKFSIPSWLMMHSKETANHKCQYAFERIKQEIYSRKPDIPGIKKKPLTGILGIAEANDFVRSRRLLFICHERTGLSVLCVRARVLYRRAK